MPSCRLLYYPRFPCFPLGIDAQTAKRISHPTIELIVNKVCRCDCSSPDCLLVRASGFFFLDVARIMPAAYWDETPADLDDHEYPDADPWDEDSSEPSYAPLAARNVYEDADLCPVCGKFMITGYPLLVGQTHLVDRPRVARRHRTCRGPSSWLLTARGTICASRIIRELVKSKKINVGPIYEFAETPPTS